MARKCFITGKRPAKGHNVSHANNKSKRTWGVNVQKVRILVDGKPKRVYVEHARSQIGESATRITMTGICRIDKKHLYRCFFWLSARSIFV